MPPFFYRKHGLVLASEIALPAGCGLDRSGDIRADVTLRVGEVPPYLPTCTHRGATWRADARHFLLDLAGIGRFLAVDGSVLTVAPAPGMAVDDILVFATGAAMAAILYQRGALLLHGAAVAHRGRAVIICGESGIGKSTLAGALCNIGCTLVADDIGAIGTRPDGVPMVIPDGRALCLASDSIGHLGMEGARGARVRRTIDRFHVSPPRCAGLDEAGVPVAAICILTGGDAGTTPRITQLSPVTAAQALLRFTYRRRLALVHARSGQMAVRTAALVSRCGTHMLERPKVFAALADSAACVLDHLDRTA